jgi:hypothetical protein
MARFRFWMWLGGFIYLAEGLARVFSFGLWVPSWTTQFGCWYFLNGEN